jgi:hypothetical protein
MSSSSSYDLNCDGDAERENCEKCTRTIIDPTKRCFALCRGTNEMCKKHRRSGGEYFTCWMHQEYEEDAKKVAAIYQRMHSNAKRRIVTRDTQISGDSDKKKSIISDTESEDDDDHQFFRKKRTRKRIIEEDHSDLEAGEEEEEEKKEEDLPTLPWTWQQFVYTPEVKTATEMNLGSDFLKERVKTGQRVAVSLSYHGGTADTSVRVTRKNKKTMSSDVYLHGMKRSDGRFAVDYQDMLIPANYRTVDEDAYKSLEHSALSRSFTNDEVKAKAGKFNFIVDIGSQFGERPRYQILWDINKINNHLRFEADGIRFDYPLDESRSWYECDDLLKFKVPYGAAVILPPDSFISSPAHPMTPWLYRKVETGETLRGDDIEKFINEIKADNMRSNQRLLDNLLTWCIQSRQTMEVFRTITSLINPQSVAPTKYKGITDLDLKHYMLLNRASGFLHVLRGFFNRIGYPTEVLTVAFLRWLADENITILFWLVRNGKVPAAILKSFAEGLALLHTKNAHLLVEELLKWKGIQGEFIDWQMSPILEWTVDIKQYDGPYRIPILLPHQPMDTVIFKRLVDWRGPGGEHITISQSKKSRLTQMIALQSRNWEPDPSIGEIETIINDWKQNQKRENFDDYTENDNTIRAREELKRQKEIKAREELERRENARNRREQERQRQERDGRERERTERERREREKTEREKQKGPKTRAQTLNDIFNGRRNQETCNELLCDLKITNKKSGRDWMRANHPDKHTNESEEQKQSRNELFSAVASCTGTGGGVERTPYFCNR